VEEEWNSATPNPRVGAEYELEERDPGYSAATSTPRDARTRKTFMPKVIE
jgi:hypothetical protein